MKPDVPLKIIASELAHIWVSFKGTSCLFRIHPWQNSFDLSITGHFLEVHMSEDDETCLYCHCNVTRGQGVKWGVEFRY